jgi:hypothetical protein
LLGLFYFVFICFVSAKIRFFGGFSKFEGGSFLGLILAGPGTYPD